MFIISVSVATVLVALIFALTFSDRNEKNRNAEVQKAAIAAGLVQISIPPHAEDEYSKTIWVKPEQVAMYLDHYTGDC